MPSGAGAGPASLPTAYTVFRSLVADWLLGALALMFIFEGLLPLLSPTRWRSVFESALRLSNGQIRFIGLVSIVAGAVLLLICR
jgi:uncharacterized protein